MLGNDADADLDKYVEWIVDRLFNGDEYAVDDRENPRFWTCTGK